MFEVEKGVPIPSQGKASSTKYPFEGMGVGDSFKITGGKDVVKKVRSAACYFGRAYGVKFTIRKEGRSARCWRVG